MQLVFDRMTRKTSKNRLWSDKPVAAAAVSCRLRG